MDNAEIQTSLQNLGARVPPSSRLVLLGGSALILLGSPRPTLDIDFWGDDVHPNSFHQLVMQIAKELQIHVEPVPLDRFIPLPEGSEERSIRIGQYGNLEIQIADPYSIALSKVDRGFETDIDDILFLIRQNFVTLAELERLTRKAISQGGKFDLHPDILEHLQDLKDQLK
jgi:hypothetical protein